MRDYIYGPTIAPSFQIVQSIQESTFRMSILFDLHYIKSAGEVEVGNVDCRNSISFVYGRNLAEINLNPPPIALCAWLLLLWPRARPQHRPCPQQSQDY